MILPILYTKTEATPSIWHPLQISVLADTSYNSLSVDEVAAQHAQADCVVNVPAIFAAYACLSFQYHMWA